MDPPVLYDFACVIVRFVVLKFSWIIRRPMKDNEKLEPHEIKDVDSILTVLIFIIFNINIEAINLIRFIYCYKLQLNNQITAFVSGGLPPSQLSVITVTIAHQEL